MSKRPYTQRKRAQAQEDTRARIVEATMRLHEEIGPRATTISAIAERAGVQRLTVYRHFPDESAVFQACTSHWLELNPLPDPAAWQAAPDGRSRLRAALSAIYAYYRSTERMWVASYRDESSVPALQPPMAAFRTYLSGIADDLASHIPAGDKVAVRATVRHAVLFPTWQSLAAQDMTDDDIAETVVAWVEGLSASG